MKQRFLLRAEATNLDNFVFDTSRLPTVRGGGLLLLRAPERILEWLGQDQRAHDVEKVRVGASACVLRLAAEEKDAPAIRSAIETLLARHDDLRHATFAVDIVPAGEDFIADQERLVALNRFRQLRSPTVVFPAETKEGGGACVVDGIRPGTERYFPPGERAEKAVSSSVRARTDYGRRQKQRFYREEAGQAGGSDPALSEMRYTHDFQELAHDPKRGKLNGKMAVLYVDGNDFGGIQRRRCQDVPSTQSFEKLLLDTKRGMLRQVLEAINADQAAWTYREHDAEDVYRLETLLWGGDEFLFVVPAWRGWWLAGEVLEQLAGKTFGGEELTFAAGLVFCHANAPIRRIRDLSEMLAAEAKNESRKQTLLAYQVMETFDVVPGDFASFRKGRSAFGERNAMLVDGAKVRSLGEAVGALRESVSRKRLYRAIEEVLRSSGDGSAFRAQIMAQPKAVESWKQLEGASRTKAAAIVHLAELWDYLPDEEHSAPQPESEEVALAR